MFRPALYHREMSLSASHESSQPKMKTRSETTKAYCNKLPILLLYQYLGHGIFTFDCKDVSNVLYATSKAGINKYSVQV